jgi:hypothetical protein
MNAPHRLIHLLELADKGPALRAALAEELAELLTDWPADCPNEMRGPCEALLARAACEVDDNIRARLRVRLYADPALAARVLPREDVGKSLIEMARGGEDIATKLTQALGLPQTRIEEILSDTSGRALATACKGLGLSRAVFSSLAILADHQRDVAQSYTRLDVYDDVSATDAARQLRFWRESPAIQSAMQAA